MLSKQDDNSNVAITLFKNKFQSDTRNSEDF